MLTITPRGPPPPEFRSRSRSFVLVKKMKENKNFESENLAVFVPRTTIWKMTCSVGMVYLDSDDIFES